MDFYSILSIILALAIMLGYLNHRFIRMQTTIAIMSSALMLSIILIIVGKLGFDNIEITLTTMLRTIPFHDLVINGMLSFLLFAGGLNIDMHYLKNQKWEITALAVAGTILSSFMIGTAVYLLLPFFGIQIGYIYSLLFGALISPTDPIAVLAIFKILDAPKSLKAIVEGESLFNDGVAIVIFLTIYQLQFISHVVTWQSTILLFLSQIFGGVLYGVILGLTAYKLIKSIDDNKIKILITLLIVTAGYTSARLMHISGPLAMVVSGMFIGKRKQQFSMSKKTVESLDNFWELIEEILNAILFLLIGLELLALQINKSQIFAALSAIPLTLCVRSVVVVLIMGCFKIKRSYPPYTNSILIWGALRGGLALALALALPPTQHRNLILSMTYAVVAFSVIIQGLSIKPLINRSKKS